MDRKDFFGNLAGLIGVAANVKELAKIGLPQVKEFIFPISARVGDIFLDAVNGKTYFFTGRMLRNITERNDDVFIERGQKTVRNFKKLVSAIENR